MTDARMTAVQMTGDLMTRTRRSLGLALLALLLGACTGSFEAPNPVLLVTGFQRGVAGGSPTNHVGLIRDSLALSDSRFTFLDDSVRALPAPSRSYDVTNRENARNTLVVLSRDAGTAGSSSSYVSSFSLSRISADAPRNFRRTRPDLDINTVVPVPRNFPSDPYFCPSKIQVTQDGTYAAVLNVPSLCGVGAAQNFIDILDLRGQGRLLQRLNGVAGGGLYMSQGAATDTLYYAVESPRSLTFNAATMPRPSQAFGQDDTLAIRANFASVTRQLGLGDFVDLGLSGLFGSDKLAVLFGQGLAYISGYTDEGAAEGPVETLENDNARLVRDDLRQTDATLVLATAAGRRLSYFPLSFIPDTGDTLISGEVRADVAAIDGVIEANSGFAYFVANQQVSLFDLNAYDAGETLRVTRFPPLLELTNPNFVTWAQAVPAALP